LDRAVFSARVAPTIPATAAPRILWRRRYGPRAVQTTTSTPPPPQFDFWPVALVLSLALSVPLLLPDALALFVSLPEVSTSVVPSE
jgi:hypothetical protein